MGVFGVAGRPVEDGAVFSFLTTGYDGDPAGHIVGAIHPKAIPVILHREDHERWLHASVKDALGLASAFPSQLMAVA
jgi:putative SOS response-associated peptidase YedK